MYVTRPSGACQDSTEITEASPRHPGVDPGLLRHYDPRRANVPEDLIRYQRDLELKPPDLALLNHLLVYRYKPESPIFPSIATLAWDLNCDQRTVQRRLRRLVDRGLLVIQRRSYATRHGKRPKDTSNDYILTPLFNKLAALVARKRAAQLGLPTPPPVPTPSEPQNCHPPEDITARGGVAKVSHKTPEPEPEEPECEEVPVCDAVSDDAAVGTSPDQQAWHEVIERAGLVVGHRSTLLEGHAVPTSGPQLVIGFGNHGTLERARRLLAYVQHASERRLRFVLAPSPVPPPPSPMSGDESCTSSTTPTATSTTRPGPASSPTRPPSGS